MGHSPVLIPCTDPHCMRADKHPLSSLPSTETQQEGPRSALCAPCAAARSIRMDTYDYTLSGQCPECGLRFLSGAEARATGLEGAIQAWPPPSWRAGMLPTRGSATSSLSQAAGLHSEEPFRLLPAPLPTSTATSPCHCQECSYPSRYLPLPPYMIPAPVPRAAPVPYRPRPGIAAYPQPTPKEEHIHEYHFTPSPSPPPAPSRSSGDDRVTIHLEERLGESAFKPKLALATDTTVPQFTPMVLQPVAPAPDSDSGRVGVASSGYPARVPAQPQQRTFRFDNRHLDNPASIPQRRDPRYPSLSRPVHATATVNTGPGGGKRARDHAREGSDFEPLPLHKRLKMDAAGVVDAESRAKTTSVHAGFTLGKENAGPRVARAGRSDFKLPVPA
ncbi:hypothetical protein HMN09_00810600 [Mycena chlorophos]|uniref:Uncharacterized protein n=1 Tax=Mycena chlorophos TaxID=658473 RepID=A0A8H6WAR8_MYCCL|nr:hypothetical protein HMN09_00810600 [Mycena chlorophos]